MRQVAALLGIVNAIANNKIIWNIKSNPIDLYVNLTA